MQGHSATSGRGVYLFTAVSSVTESTDEEEAALECVVKEPN
jgi:hypothetical protein